MSDDDKLLQTIYDCDEHEGCAVIVGYQFGREVWRSHWDAALPPETRLNPDFPDAVDYRDPLRAEPDEGARLRAMPAAAAGGRKVKWRLPTDGELDHPAAVALGWDKGIQTRMAAYAFTKGNLTERDAREAGADVREAKRLSRTLEKTQRPLVGRAARDSVDGGSAP